MTMGTTLIRDYKEVLGGWELSRAKLAGFTSGDTDNITFDIVIVNLDAHDFVHILLRR